MAIGIALLGSNDPGSSLTPTFLHYLELSLHCPKMIKQNQCRKLRKFEDFYPQDMESCHLAAARHVKLWSLNTNLFFEELHQLANFA